MELKVNSGTVSLSCKQTPDDLMKALAALTEQLTKLNGNRTKDTDAPVIFGNGRFDVRQGGNVVHVFIGTDIGWVTQAFDLGAASGLAAQICSHVQTGIGIALASAEAAQSRNSIQ